MNIQINQLIEWIGDDRVTERVLMVDNQTRQVLTIEVLKNGKRVNRIQTSIRTIEEIQQAIELADAIFLDTDPFAYRLISDDAYTEANLKRRDERWKAIGPIVEQGPSILVSGDLGSLITERSRIMNRREGKDENIRNTVYYRYVRLYFQGGQHKNALLTDYLKCGGKGKPKAVGDVKKGRPHRRGKDFGINVTDTVRAQFRKAANKHFREKGTYKTRADAFQWLLETYYNAGYEQDENGQMVPRLRDESDRPSIEQFYSFLKHEYGEVKIAEKEVGERKAKLLFTQTRQSSRLGVRGPGAEYQADSSPIDLRLRSVLRRDKVVQSGTAYLIVDIASNAIASFFPTLEHPSWESFRLAVEQAVQDKTTYWRQYGVNVSKADWPVKGIPETIRVDRGTEFTSNYGKLLVENVEVNITFTAPYSPNMKAIVEKLFDVMNDIVVKRLPGATFDWQRGDKDYIIESTLTMYEFRQIMAEAVVYYNKSHYIENYPFTKQMVQDDVIPNPIELWNWGIQNHTGILRYLSPDQIRYGLLHRASATYTKSGVKFKGAHYLSDDNHVMEMISIAATRRQKIDVEIIHNPYMPANLIYIPRDGQLIPCYLSDPANQMLFENADFWEVEGFVTDQDHKKDDFKESAGRQAKAKLNANADAIVEKAKSQTAAAVKANNTSKAEQKADRIETTQAERDYERAERYGLAEAPPHQHVFTNEEEPQSTDIEATSSGILPRQRKARQLRESAKNTNTDTEE